MRKKRIVWLAAAMVLVCGLHASGEDNLAAAAALFTSEEAMPSPGTVPGLPEYGAVNLAAEADLFTGADQTEEIPVFSDLHAQEDAAEIRDAAWNLRQGLDARMPAIPVTVSCHQSRDADSLFDEIRAMALSSGENEWEDDDLWYSIEDMDPGAVLLETDGERWIYRWDTRWQYYASLEQERALNTRIGQVLAQMKLEGLSDREKTERIYRWIVSSAEYDDSESSESHSAYAAMFTDRAVCQGFSMLFAKLLTGAGISNRIVTGQDHMWNLVGVDGLYYNCDVTWEITRGDGTQYLLRWDDAFEADHVRDERFLSEEFLLLYPSASPAQSRQ